VDLPEASKPQTMEDFIEYMVKHKAAKHLENQELRHSTTKSSIALNLSIIHFYMTGNGAFQGL
jgi:hypothetical protein